LDQAYKGGLKDRQARKTREGTWIPPRRGVYGEESKLILSL